MRHHDLCPLLQWKPLRVSSQAPSAYDPATGTQRTATGIVEEGGNMFREPSTRPHAARTHSTRDSL